jgi:hypothetical protein
MHGVHNPIDARRFPLRLLDRAGSMAGAGVCPGSPALRVNRHRRTTDPAPSAPILVSNAVCITLDPDDDRTDFP